VTLREYKVRRLIYRRETRSGRLNFGRITPAITTITITFCGVYLFLHTFNWNVVKGSIIFSVYATHLQNLALKRALLVKIKSGLRPQVSLPSLRVRQGFVSALFRLSQGYFNNSGVYLSIVGCSLQMQKLNMVGRCQRLVRVGAGFFSFRS
jgi:hypothetical protein